MKRPRPNSGNPRKRQKAELKVDDDVLVDLQDNLRLHDSLNEVEEDNPFRPVQSASGRSPLSRNEEQERKDGDLLAHDSDGHVSPANGSDHDDLIQPLRRDHVTPLSETNGEDSKDDFMVWDTSHRDISSQEQVEDPNALPEQDGVRVLDGDINAEHASTSEDQDEDADDSENEEEESQQLSRNNGFSQCGVLHSVRLDRFMSHSCFSYDLCQNVNIINGDNGSGKSAICAAIQMGLGARPSSTDRSKNVDGFIKHGENNAVVTLKILNKKPDIGPDMTYKYDLYGDYIIVERRMFRGRNGKAGSNSWTIKGKKRSVKLQEGQTARREVMDMVDHFGFMVNNPVAVLNQENSKKFLAKGKPKEHYELYQEATLLAPLKKELESTIVVTEKVKRLVKAREASLPEVSKQLSKLKAAHEDAQEMKNIHHHIRDGASRLAWTKHQELDTDLSAKKKRTSEEFEAKAEECTRKTNATESKVNMISSDVDRLTQEVTEANQKVSQLGSTFRLSKLEHQKVSLEIRGSRERIDSLDSDVKEMDRNIQNSESEMERAMSEHFKGQEQKTALVNEKTELSEREIHLLGVISDREKEQQALSSEEFTLRESINNLRDEASRWDRDLDARKREYVRIDQMMKNANDLTKFGQYVPMLEDKIRRMQGKFEVCPVGPIGMYVKVHDDSWVPVIEEAVGPRFLMSYIVNNYQDQKLMMGLLGNSRQRPQVLVTNMRNPRYIVDQRTKADVDKYGHRTLLDMITVKNDTVFNALLDFVHIEQVVMLHGDEEITQFGWKEVPNMRIVWNKQGERAFSRNGSRLHRGLGGQTLTARFLTKDMRPYLNQLREEVLLIEQQKNTVEQKRNNVVQRINELRVQTNSLSSSLGQTRADVHKISQKKANIEDQLRRTDSEFDASPYTRTIDEYKGRKEDYIRQRNALEGALVDKELKLVETKANSNGALSALQDGRAEQEALSKKLMATQELSAQARSRLRQFKSELAAAELRLEQAHKRLQEVESDVAEAYEVAMSSGPCPPDVDHTKESSSMIEKRLTVWRKRLETEQTRRGGKSADEIEHEFLVAQTNHEKNRKKLVRVKSYLQSLRVGARYREENLRRLEKALKKMVRSNFRQFMATRRHSGNIRFVTEGNHKELLISTEMASHEKGDGERFETKDLRSLSGGERSFTTLCFMMALAEICSVPVRVMDEIDVFQDEANRRASFKMLIEFFTKFLSHRQIVLITPHALPNIDPSPQVRIVRLKKPREDDSSLRQTQIDSYYE